MLERAGGNGFMVCLVVFGLKVLIGACYGLSWCNLAENGVDIIVFGVNIQWRGFFFVLIYVN